jgi:hypothetical protein
MKSKVQIINYSQDGNFQDRYNQIECEPNLPFRIFKLGPTLDLRILKLGAKESIDYYNLRWKHISGLIPVKRIPNVYYGDLMGKDTIAVWIQPDKKIIVIAIFNGHRPKLRTAREKKVINFINTSLRAKNKG